MNDLLPHTLRALAADYRLELVPKKFRQSMVDAADEIERLRAAVATETCPYVVGRTTLHCSLTPLTLTDEEREAIELAAGDYIYHQDPGGRAQHIRATLLGLLERTK